MPLSARILGGHLVVPATRVPVGSGLRAAAGPDEDVVTLAAAAGLAVLDDLPAVRPRAAVLATVSAPLAEGGSAQLVAELTGLAGMGLHVQEHAGTVAAGASALISAMALAATGSGPVLVVGADTRRDSAGIGYGDGAVALVLDAGTAGDADLGELRYLGSAAEAFPDHWRLDGDSTARASDASFARTGPGAGHAGALFGPGVHPDVLVEAVRPEVARIGHLGCASIGVHLLLALGGDREVARIAASAGGVTHAFALYPGRLAAAAGSAAAAAVAGGVASQSPPAMPAGPAEAFDPYASQPRSWRERRADLGLEGVRCGQCGQVLYPAAPACPFDGPGARLEPYRLARSGRVLTFTRDHVFPSGGPLSMAVIDVDGGGRFYGQVGDAAAVSVGTAVRLVPRLLHRGGGRPQYFWKIVPKTASEGVSSNADRR